MKPTTIDFKTLRKSIKRASMYGYALPSEHVLRLLDMVDFALVVFEDMCNCTDEMLSTGKDCEACLARKHIEKLIEG